MKLESLTVIFVLGVVGVAKMVNGLCLLKNTYKPRKYWFHCYLSNNYSYMADVRSAPIDVPVVTFSNAQIELIRNRSFHRLGNSLKMLQINFCETREIEDHAFAGLVGLQTLDLAENNLQVVKGVWFKGLSNLKTVILRSNEIKRIEKSFYSIVPPLELLDLSANELNCFPMPSIETFKTNKIRFRYNPLSWECVSSLMYWVEKTGIEYDDFGRADWDPSWEFVRVCKEKLGKPYDQLNEEDLRKCAEKSVIDYLPPDKGNYTVEQVCQFLKDKPSPFLVCP